MRRSGGPQWTVGWSGHGEPREGHIVHRFTPTQQDAGFWRVTGVRLVMHRKPLPPGYTARYRVSATFIGESFRRSDWTLNAHPRKNPEQTRTKPDRFSPLL